MSSKPQIVTSYRRELISQNPETSLGSYLDENSSTVVCFTMSPNAMYVVGDSNGNLIVGQKTNRVIEFQQINVFTHTFANVFTDSTQIICIGKDKDQKDYSIKLVELKNKKLLIKSTHQTQISEDITCNQISPDGQFLALGDALGYLNVFKFPKLKNVFQYQLKQKEKQIPIMNISFYTPDNNQTLKPSDVNQKQPKKQDKQLDENIQQQQQINVRSIILSGSTQNQSHTEAVIITYHVNNINEFQFIQLSNVFMMTPFLLKQYSCFTDNKLIYLTSNKTKQNQQLLESIQINDQKQISTCQDVKDVIHIVKQPILNNIIIKDCQQIQQLQSFKQNECILVTDQYLQIFTTKNRISYFATDFNQQYLLSYDSVHQSYILLQNNPNNIALIEIQPIEVEQLIDSLLSAKLYDEAVNLALDQRSRCKAHKQASVRQIYAQQLFELGRYEEACEQYIETVGVLEPSVVVRAFLEHGRTLELTSYLEALHAGKSAASSHTNLLMNCYVKNNDINRLIRFVRAAEENYIKNKEQPVFNVQLACQNLIQSKLDDIAIEIALTLDNEVYACQLLIQRNRIQEVLQILPTLQAGKTAEIIQQYGNELMADSDLGLERITELIKQLCLSYKQQNYEQLKNFITQLTEQQSQNQQSSDSSAGNKYYYINIIQNKQQQQNIVVCNNRIDEFVHLFVERRYEIQLVKIIGDLVKQKLQNHTNQEPLVQQQQQPDPNTNKWKKGNPTAPQVQQPQQVTSYEQLQLSEICLETYFELLLKQQQYRLGKFQQDNMLNSQAQLNNSQIPFIQEIDDDYILQVLKQIVENQNFRLSLDHLLILFQTYECRPCIIFTLLQLNMKQECIKFYAQNNQFNEAIQLYKEADNEAKQQLYVDLLQLAVQQQSQEQINSNIKQVLQVFESDKTQSISCLNILELLVQFNNQLELQTIYDYLKNQLQFIDEQTIQSYQNYSNSLKTIEETKKQIEEMKKPKLFTKHQNCQKCNLQIEAPCVYVRCGHVFHEKCWKSCLQQCSCWQVQQQEQLLQKVEFEVESYKTFADVLGGFVGNQFLNQQQNQEIKK